MPNEPSDLGKRPAPDSLPGWRPPRETLSRDEVWERRSEISAPLDASRYSTLLRLVRDEGNRVVVSFGGGSIPGLSGNLALARILEELEVRPHVAEVWGTSAGAVCGGGWATSTG